MFGLFKEKEELNYLEMTPLRNYEHELNESKLIDVLVPKFKNEFLRDFLVPRSRSPYIKANLDEFGSETWLLMNGENKVELIADKLNEKFETMKKVLEEEIPVGTFDVEGYEMEQTESEEKADFDATVADVKRFLKKAN